MSCFCFDNFLSRLRVLGCLLLAGTSAAVFAAEYSFEYQIGAQAETNDNVRMAIEDNDVPDDGVESITGHTVSPDFVFTARTERFDANLHANLDFSQYDKQQYDSDDQNVALKLGYEFERQSFGLDIGVIRDSTRTSEYLDTGVVESSASRKETLTFAPNWEYQLNERNLLGASYSYTDVRYMSDRLTDYEYHSLNTTWTYIVNERLRLMVQPYITSFDAPSSFSNAGPVQCQLTQPFILSCIDQSIVQDVTADTYGVQAGFDWVLNEKLTISALMGGANASTDNETVINETVAPPFDIPLSQTTSNKTDARTSVGNIKLNYQEEQYRASLALSISTNASGNGYLNQSENINGRIDYDLSEKFTLFSDLTWGKNTQDDNELPRYSNDGTILNPGSDDRDFIIAQAGIRYRLNEDWTVSGTYLYNESSRDQAQDTADSNTFFLNLTYKPTKQTWSR